MLECEKQDDYKVITLRGDDSIQAEHRYLVLSQSTDVALLVCSDVSGYTVTVPYVIQPLCEGAASLGALLWDL